MDAGPCTCCGRVLLLPYRRQGWCASCYSRWRALGKPPSLPPPARQGAPRTRLLAACPSCGNDEGGYCRGWCARCYRRWLRTGRPEQGPPPPQRSLDKAGHLADCQYLLEQGITSAAELARRLGVHPDTVRGYLRELRTRP